jgi:hypothetical protein
MIFHVFPLSMADFSPDDTSRKGCRIIVTFSVNKPPPNWIVVESIDRYRGDSFEVNSVNGVVKSSASPTLAKALSDGVD